jgi:hypothetical protein
MWLGKECCEIRKSDVEKKDCLLNLGVIIRNVKQTELKEKRIWILQLAKRYIQEE